jgi:hypothetical protein
MKHTSDCAMHNAPALEPKACDCGADSTPDVEADEDASVPTAEPGPAIDRLGYLENRCLELEAALLPFTFGAYPNDFVSERGFTQSWIKDSNVQEARRLLPGWLLTCDRPSEDEAFYRELHAA